MDYRIVRQLKGLSLRKAVAEALGYQFISTNNGSYVLVSPTRHCHGTYRVPDWDYAPAFESDIAEAMPLAEKHHYAVIPVGDRWFAYPIADFIDENGHVDVLIDDLFCGDSPAEAICRCFLLREVK